MAKVRELTTPVAGNPVFRDQLVTVSDLDRVKSEILIAVRQMLLENKLQSSKQWLKSYEVKKLLNISTGTLHTLRINGTLPFSRIGRLIYYNVDVVNNILEERQKLIIPNARFV